MKFRKDNFYVITGGPGVGKTTLLHELNKSGYQIVPEEARRIIKEQVQLGGEGLPWKNKVLYTDLMLRSSLETYNQIKSGNSSSIYFFDRGILDALCYANMTGIGISGEMDKIARDNLYNKKVFLLPPWLEIYKTDTERKQTWKEATLTFSKMKGTYLKYGYHIIEMPKDTVDKRRNYVIEIIESE
jgi:predicted ATPase